MTDQERYEYLKRIRKSSWYYKDKEFVKEYKKRSNSANSALNKKLIIRNANTITQYEKSREEFQTLPARNFTKESFSEKERERLRKLPLKEYFKTYYWQYVNQGVCRQKKYTCEICGKKTIKVYAYKKGCGNQGYEKTKSLIVLCRKCFENNYKPNN